MLAESADDSHHVMLYLLTSLKDGRPVMANFPKSREANAKIGDVSHAVPPFGHYNDSTCYDQRLSLSNLKFLSSC